MGSSQIWDQTCVPSIGRQILNHWTTWEAPLKMLKFDIIVLVYSGALCTQNITFYRNVLLVVFKFKSWASVQLIFVICVDCRLSVQSFFLPHGFPYLLKISYILSYF